MKVVLSRRAIADLFWIADNIDNRAAARATENAIRDAIDRLATFPEIGRLETEVNARIWTVRVRRRSYIIFYRINGDVVLVSHIRDGRRRPLKPGDT